MTSSHALQSRLIDGTLRWLVGNRDRFALPTLEEDDRERSIIIGSKRKAFGELCLACMVMSRQPEVREQEDFRILCDHADEQLRNPDTFFHMARRVNLYPFYLTTVVSLEACGYRYPHYRDMLGRILAFGFIDAVDQTPWNQLDLRYFCDSGGFQHGFPDVEVLYELSIARKLPPIPLLRELDVYAITHILFFLSDFGRRDLEPLLGERYQDTCTYVDLLLGLFVHRRSWDLAAELLMSCSCLRVTPSAIQDLAWLALTGAQTDAGDIPGPPAEEDQDEVESEEDGEARLFQTNYHPTLASLMAGLLARQ